MRSASILTAILILTAVAGSALAASPCPVAVMKPPLPPGGGAPGMDAGAQRPRLTTATSVAASDTSTSIVIHPDIKDQITCGKTTLDSSKDVVFATRTLPDGRSMNLLLDVQIPAGKGEWPLVVYVPGGGFVMAMKEGALNLRTYVAEAGFVVATIQYRVVGDGAKYQDGVADVKSAVRYLRANARRYHIDPHRVAVWGESAGGYMVSMVGVTNGEKSFDVGDNLDQSSDVQAVIDKFGPSDISKVGADFDATMQAAYADPRNPIFLYTPRDLTAANPLTLIKPSDPPFLIFSGSQDVLVSPSQTLLLHNALRAAGVTSTRYVIEGASHGDMAFMGDMSAGLPWSTRQTMDLMVDFLNRTIGHAHGK